jgi:hypothetical protein
MGRLPAAIAQLEKGYIYQDTFIHLLNDRCLPQLPATMSLNFKPCLGPLEVRSDNTSATWVRLSYSAIEGIHGWMLMDSMLALALEFFSKGNKDPHILFTARQTCNRALWRLQACLMRNMWIASGRSFRVTDRSFWTAKSQGHWSSNTVKSMRPGACC